MMASPSELDRARDLIFRHGWESTCYQILNPGIRRFFSGAGLIGYGESRRDWVTAGAPIASQGDRDRLLDAFIREAQRLRRRVCFFGIEKDYLAELQANRRTDHLLLGAQPVWDPRSWSSIIERKSSLRYQLHRATHKGVVVEEWSEAKVGQHPALRRCLQQWVAERGLPSLHFLVEPGTLSRLKGRRVFVAL